MLISVIITSTVKLIYNGIFGREKRGTLFSIEKEIDRKTLQIKLRSVNKTLFSNVYIVLFN